MSEETKEIAEFPVEPSKSEIMVDRTDPMMVIAEAVKSGNVSVENLERLMAMRREIKAEKAREAYHHAKNELQAELPVVGKTEKAGSGNFTYPYAPLEVILLAKNKDGKTALDIAKKSKMGKLEEYLKQKGAKHGWEIR